MLQFNVKTNIDAFQKKVSAAAYRQIPFATSQALTAIARLVAKAEADNEVKVLDRPRPFTTGAIGVIPARKERQTAVVFVKDITARYLEPYEFGGKNILNSRALLKPVGAKTDLDQYGNLPRSFLRKLKGRADIFIGPVRTKRGVVNGVWQRAGTAGAKVARVQQIPARSTQTRVSKSGKLILGKTTAARTVVRQVAPYLPANGQTMRLLIKFDDAHLVRQHLGWFDVAGRMIAREFNREMGRALARAIATAK